MSLSSLRQLVVSLGIAGVVVGSACSSRDAAPFAPTLAQHSDPLKPKGGAPAETGNVDGLQALSCPPNCALAQEVLTQHNDKYRRGAQLNETSLTASAFPSTFHLLGTAVTDGIIRTQPLYAENITIGGTTADRAYVGTSNGTLYAIDTTSPFATHASPSLGNCPASECLDKYSIVGTPVIDKVNGYIYVVSMHSGLPNPSAGRRSVASGQLVRRRGRQVGRVIDEEPAVKGRTVRTGGTEPKRELRAREQHSRSLKLTYALRHAGLPIVEPHSTGRPVD